MRIAMLIVGVVAGLVVAGLFVLVMVVAATAGERSSGARGIALLLGVMSVAWLFGVAFTWGRPNWARPCYFVAALCGVVAGVGGTARTLGQIAPWVLAGIAGALVIMSFWAASELDAKSEEES